MKQTISETRRVAKMEVLIDELNRELAGWMTQSPYHFAEVVYEERQIIGHPHTVPLLRIKCFIRASSEDPETINRNGLPQNIQIVEEQEDIPDPTQDLTKNERFIDKILRKVRRNKNKKHSTKTDKKGI